jgi:Ca2+-binding RTX toxin-like protein
MNLGGGNDKVEEFSSNSGFDVLNSLTVDFGSGEDEVTGNWIHLTWSFSGGEGNDDLAGGYGEGTLLGGPGDDRLFGGDANEVMRGGPGADDITGLGGNDEIFGDEGNDTLVGSSGGDSITGGPGTDNVQGDGTLNAFSGNDTLHLVDGEPDSGACGLGADVVDADRVDVISDAGDCEVVNRTGSGGPGGGGTGAVALGKPVKVSARKRLVSSKVSCPAAAVGSCTGRATFTLTFVERGKKRKVVLGKVSFSLSPGQKGTVRRKLSKTLYARLRKAKKRKLKLAATSRDSSGTTFKSSRTFTLSL